MRPRSTQGAQGALVQQPSTFFQLRSHIASRVSFNCRFCKRGARGSASRMDDFLDNRQVSSGGVFRCPKCRMLFNAEHQLEKHLQKYCAVNQSRTDTHPLNAGRSDRSFGGNSSFLQPSVAPARDEVERESTRLLRELEDYHKRNREQRKASDDQQRKIADQLLDKDSLRKRDGARSAGKVPLSQLLRDGEKVSTETFRRKVKELSDTSRSGYDVRIRRTPSPDIKYVLKLTPKPRLPSPPPQPQPEPRDRNAFNIAAKLEDLRAHLTSLQFKDDSDPVTDYILQVK